MPRGAQLLQVVPQLLGARGMAELAQGLDLDLADALAGHAKALADLFQGALVTVDEPKAELEHAPLAWDKGSERGLDRKLEHGDRGDVRGGRGLLVLDEIAELGILFMADRCLQRDRRLRELDDLSHPLEGEAHLLGNLLVGGLPAQNLEHAPRNPGKLVDDLPHVDRGPNRPRLVGDGADDSLADPPSCVGREIVAQVVVELLDRADQAYVALLDQVEEWH